MFYATVLLFKSFHWKRSNYWKNSKGWKLFQPFTRKLKKICFFFVFFFTINYIIMNIVYNIIPLKSSHNSLTENSWHTVWKRLHITGWPGAISVTSASSLEMEAQAYRKRKKSRWKMKDERSEKCLTGRIWQTDRKREDEGSRYRGGCPTKDLEEA